MILSKKEITQLNLYFREFVIAQKDYFSSFENEPEYKTLIKIEKKEKIPFDKNWEYLMVLVQIIERKWNFRLIETKDNWVRFTINEHKAYQDKGSIKIKAFYTCCFKILEKLWKDKKAPLKYNSHEPFDENDLK